MLAIKSTLVTLLIVLLSITAIIASPVAPVDATTANPVAPFNDLTELHFRIYTNDGQDILIPLYPNSCMNVATPNYHYENNVKSAFIYVPAGVKMDLYGFTMTGCVNGYGEQSGEISVDNSNGSQGQTYDAMPFLCEGNVASVHT